MLTMISDEVDKNVPWNPLHEVGLVGNINKRQLELH